MKDENNFPHKGMIELVDRVITSSDHVYLHILVPNPDGFLSPGLVARVQVQMGTAGTGFSSRTRVSPNKTDVNTCAWWQKTTPSFAGLWKPPSELTICG